MNEPTDLHTRRHAHSAAAAWWRTVSARTARIWTRWREATDPDRPDCPAWVAITGYTLGALMATAATVGALAGLLSLLGRLLDLAAGGIVAGATWVGGQPLTHVITDPVHTYLTTHAAPLGVEPRLLWWCWAGAALVLLVLSWAGSVGARIGWVLIGAATAAMVHTTTPAGGTWLATGVTACAWGLLSVLAFTGAARALPIEIHTHPPNEPPTKSEGGHL